MSDATPSTRRTIAVVTGTRAEYGLLRPVMSAIAKHPRLKLQVYVAGAHLLPPQCTINEVAREFPITAIIPMQEAPESVVCSQHSERGDVAEWRCRAGSSSIATLPNRRIAAFPIGRAGLRVDDAAALGRGIQGFARAISGNAAVLDPCLEAGAESHIVSRFRDFDVSTATQPPDVVLVLGDRIEAFAAAAAASVAGIPVAHMHGGDRAEGIADEAMRHAITKLAHIHLPATEKSAMRIFAMGEDPQRVHIVGSPAIDGLDQIAPLSDEEFAELGEPEVVFLWHPLGDDDDVEYERAAKLLAAVGRRNHHIATAANCEVPPMVTRTSPGLPIAKYRKWEPSHRHVLALYPNHDPGHQGVVRAIEESPVRAVPHLERTKFVGLLRRAKVIVGNSSAGLIEGAAVGIRCINIGRRQRGREMPANVIDIPDFPRCDYQTISDAVESALKTAPAVGVGGVTAGWESRAERHPYGDGQTGPRTAALLAELDLALHSTVKRNTY